MNGTTDWIEIAGIAVQLLLGGVGAWIAIIVARHTKRYTVATEKLVEVTEKLVGVTKKQVKALDIPNVMAGISPDKDHANMMKFWVENFGTGIARDIRFNDDLNDKICNLPLQQRPDSFDGVGAVKHGVNYLAPGERRDLDIGYMLSRDGTSHFEALKKENVEIVVSYTDSAGEPYTRSFRIDFKEFEGTSGKPRYSHREKLVHGLNRVVQKFEFLYPSLKKLLERSQH